MHGLFRRGLARLVAFALVAAAASLVLWPLIARAADDSCQLTQQQKSSAVKAFKNLYPLYQDERCLNCHGGMNPFSPNTDHPGGWVNIRKAARDFLEHANLPADLVTMDAPSRATETQALRELAAGADDDVITDNDVIRVKYPAAMQYACRECHVNEWFMPMSHNHFAGRSWKQICMHMKTGLTPPTPVQFLAHMQDDSQVLLGFKGQRGLKSPTSTEPPAMPYNTMVTHANGWIEAMDAKFHQPAECGCEVEGIALEIRHRIYSDPESKTSQAGYAQFDGTIVHDAVLKREEGEGDAIYRDEFSVVRKVEVRHVKPSFFKCTGSGKRDESWRVSARVNEENDSMQLTFSFVDDAAEAEWTCTAKGYTVTDPLEIWLDGTIKTLTMSPRSGSVGEISNNDGRDIESFTVTVIDSPVGQ